MKKNIRLVAFALAFVMLAVSSMLFSTGSAAPTLNQQKNTLESELSALRSQSAKLKEQYNAALKDLSDQKTAINLLYDQIETYQKELEALDALMVEYTNLATEKEKEIDLLNEQMNKNFELFKERLVFAQESGNLSFIDFMLGSNDLSDIISRSEVINDMLEYDRKIIEGLLADRDTIEQAKQEVELALQKCQEKQQEYDAIVEELKAKQAEAEEKMSKLQNDAEALKTASERAEASKKATEDRLDAVIQQIAAQSQANQPGGSGSGGGGGGGSTVTTPVGKFIWPLPVTTPGYITQKFHSKHSGIDIGVGGWVNNGKIPAISVAAGKVVRRGYYSDWGNLIVVDHGGGYLSYYAHLASMSVTVGQQVSQGQQVGKIGSTGRSTGPHLHLVIYAPVGARGASIRTDPLRYISYPR